MTMPLVPAAASTTPELRAADLVKVLRILRAQPEGATPEQLWDAFTAADRPALFRLLDLAADLPRFAQQRALGAWPPGLWPELEEVTADLKSLQTLVDRPAMFSSVRSAKVHEIRAEEARRELEARHCVTVEGMLTPDERKVLDAEIEKQKEAREEDGRLAFWGTVEQEQAPDLHRLFAGALATEGFHRLTGWDPRRDEFSLTLALQDLQPDGIGWHRDLYWPREWVGQDVFAVLYGLGDDSPELGGAFIYHVPWEGEHGEVFAVYRRQHQATVLWNSAEQEGRIIHAVTRYLSSATRRHLVILQCLRRSEECQV